MKHRGAGEVEKPAGGRDKRRRAQRRASGGSGGRIALVLAVVGLVLIVVFILPRGGQKSAETVPRAAFVTGTPINRLDPTSNKPIVVGITSEYKGYTIGHCCAVSKQDWEVLSTDRKEEFIRRFVK
jgi:hypothetical protein